jgi:hypothetical protein
MASEARMITGSNIAEIAEWCGGVLVTEIDPFDITVTNPALNVQCGSEVKRVRAGDILIHNHDGSFMVHKR